MSGRFPAIRALDAVALICAAAGLGVAVWAACGTPPRLRTLERRAEDMVSIERLRRDSSRHDPMRALLATLPPRPAGETPASIFRSIAPEAPEPRVNASSSQPAGPGWAVRRCELVFPEIGLDILGRLVTACETARPPWRTVEARVSGLGAVGRGAATLSFEGLEPAAANRAVTP